MHCTSALSSEIAFYVVRKAAARSRFLTSALATRRQGIGVAPNSVVTLLLQAAPSQNMQSYRTFVTPTVPTTVAASPGPGPVAEAPAGALISAKRSPPIGIESGQKRFRNAALGKKSNMGTGNGGKGVAKCCAACSAREQCPVPVAGHNCPLCSKCFRESKAFVLKQECSCETHK